jgi:beta-glucosidase
MRAGDEPRDRALALLGAMTTDDKIALLHGYPSPHYTGLTAGNARLGIPPLNHNDGRQGFRPQDGKSLQTAFPCQLASVATFDKGLMRAFGEAMGEEFVGKGCNVMLAPMLILARVPQGGRNFESTGEDAELAYHFAYNMVSGAQSVPGLIANADDFLLNNQETDRGNISAVCDQRTMFELYYRGYKGAIDADVGSFMCSYVRAPPCSWQSVSAPTPQRAPQLTPPPHPTPPPTEPHQWHARLRERRDAGGPQEPPGPEL